MNIQWRRKRIEVELKSIPVVRHAYALATAVRRRCSYREDALSDSVMIAQRYHAAP